MRHHTANPLRTTFCCKPGLKAVAENSTWFDNVAIHPYPLGNEPGVHGF